MANHQWKHNRKETDGAKLTARSSVLQTLRAYPAPAPPTQSPLCSFPAVGLTSRAVHKTARQWDKCKVSTTLVGQVNHRGSIKKINWTILPYESKSGELISLLLVSSLQVVILVSLWWGQCGGGGRWGGRTESNAITAIFDGKSIKNLRIQLSANGNKWMNFHVFSFCVD